MSTAGAVASTAVGVALIGVTLRDVFDALFNPEGKGTLSRVLMRASWRALGHGRSAPLAGPVALISSVASWAVLLMVGWALIWWPHIEDFHWVGAPGSGLAEAVYFSMVTMTTIGFGDVTPASDALRLLTPLEALLGVGLLTATVSWLLGVYPALSRRRSLAYEITLLREVEEQEGRPLSDMAPTSLQRILSELTSRLVAVERDLVTFPVSYLFRERDERFALAAAMPYIERLAERAVEMDPLETRLRGRMLRTAIEDYRLSAASIHPD